MLLLRSVCLSIGRSDNWKKLWTDFDEISWRGRAWPWPRDQVIKFWWRSGSPSGSRSSKSEIRIDWIIDCAGVQRTSVLSWVFLVDILTKPSGLSVCLSVCDVEVSWDSWKIISRLISLTFPLCRPPTSRMTDLLQREQPRILAGIGVR